MSPILVLSPFVVNLLTTLIKKIKPLSMLNEGFRTAIVRFVVALLSFGSAIGIAYLSGSSVDSTVLTVFSDALLTFIGSTGLFFFGKKKEY